MSDYSRSTKEIAPGDIPADVMQSVRAHIEKYALGDILADVALCVVSTSEKIKKGWLGGGPGPKRLVQTVILTGGWLILADQADQNALYVKSMQLRDITAEDYEKSSFHAMVPDTGVNVSGRFTDASEAGMIFLPLGGDSAGDKFKALLIEAAQQAKL